MSGRPSSGEIGGDGRFRLSTYEPGDGAKPGKYSVTVTSYQVPDDGPTYNSLEDELQGKPSNAPKPSIARSKTPQATWLIPKKYSNRSTSDLAVEVTGGGEDIELALSSSP
ncbi:hypothetical protein Pla175_22520 [Pirellulimonas nuda]|uniref:Uncharacterized protein n=1 Tax=Pirellulimonas nuda TaxID=2528009 RepID=A0A518DBM6_9BACT|nr:hypothetical protein [Pirellulimonas nuda]QDU88868.1 hypothetical protein Pla175_22520 [Pirellulimonas nuda]